MNDHVSLGELAEINSENLGIQTPADYEFRYIDLGAVSRGSIDWSATTVERFSTAPSRARRRLQPGDVLFGTIRPRQQSHALFEGFYQPCVASTGFAVVRKRKGVSDPSFLRHFLLSDIVAAQATRYEVGSNYPALNEADVRKFRVPRLPIREQQRIAEILDTIDETIRLTEQIVSKLHSQHSGLVASLLKEVTRDAPLVDSGSVLDIQSGIALNPSRVPRSNPTGYLRVANVHRGELKLDGIATIEASEGERRSLGLLQGDLLVVEGHANPDEIGRCAMVTAEAQGLVFQNHLFRLRSKGIDPEFALEVLNFESTRRYWRRHCATSSGLYTINSRQLAAIPFPDVKIDSQRSFVNVVRGSRSSRDRELAYLRKLRQLRAGLESDLLSGRVRTVAA